MPFDLVSPDLLLTRSPPPPVPAPTLPGVEDNGLMTRVAAFPIGIDPDRFTQALELPEVKANIAQLLNRWGCMGG
jgi:hypothetical protein